MEGVSGLNGLFGMIYIELGRDLEFMLSCPVGIGTTGFDNILIQYHMAIRAQLRVFLEFKALE